MQNNFTKDDYLRKTKDIFRLLNDFRKNPKSLANYLENLKKYLDRKNNVLSEPKKVQVQMVEGELVFNEAISFLNGLGNLDPFILDERLCKSAMEHVMDIGPKGLLSYQSSDGTEPEERIAKYGNYIESLGENIDFGPNDAMGVIISLALDDGESDRPHRENLFKPEYKKIGIACGAHKTEFQMCVMDFAFAFLPLDSETEGSSIRNQRMTDDVGVISPGKKEIVNNNEKNNSGNSNNKGNVTMNNNNAVIY